MGRLARNRAALSQAFWLPARRAQSVSLRLAGLALARSPEWRVRTDPVRGRRRALAEEVGYWSWWLETRGGSWPKDYARRFDTTAEVADPALREVLAALAQPQASILDVGAGPASVVGCLFLGTRVTVVAADPLADEYNRLLDKAGVVPPVRTEHVEGEQLLQRFGPGRFDIAYSRNALDHAVDPMLIIQEMLGVVRSGGYVVLRHVPNEAVRQGYVQLHQWNFDEREGQFVIWRVGRETNVTRALSDRAEVTVRRESGDWIVCVIRKLGEAG